MLDFETLFYFVEGGEILHFLQVLLLFVELGFLEVGVSLVDVYSAEDNADQ